MTTTRVQALRPRMVADLPDVVPEQLDGGYTFGANVVAGPERLAPSGPED